MQQSVFDHHKVIIARLCWYIRIYRMCWHSMASNSVIIIIIIIIINLFKQSSTISNLILFYIVALIYK